MNDIFDDDQITKDRTVTREQQLQAIRVLAKHDALDLAPMLFAPMGPTYDWDAWRRRKERGEVA